MSNLQKIALTLFGQSVSDLVVPIGGTVEWDLTLEDPVTRLPIDLASKAVIMSLNSLNLKGQPILPALISRQATILSPTTNGQCTVPWASGDTYPSILPGTYGLDVWVEDNSGNRLQTLTVSVITLLPAAGVPNALITPLPAQLPLALGPPGADGASGIVSEVGSIASLRSSSLHLTVASALVRGYYADGDGGEGLFLWEGSNATTDNGGTVIKPSSVSGNGRWVRHGATGEINVRWFGAKGDDTNDDLPAFTAAIESAPRGTKVFVPAGTYKLNGNLNITRQGVFTGASAVTSQLHFTPGYGANLTSFQEHGGAGPRSDYTEFSNLGLNGTSPPYWQANTHFNVGDTCINVNAYGAFTQMVQRCVQAGTTGGTEPTWPTKRYDGTQHSIEGAHTNDGGVIWESRSAPGLGIRAVDWVRNLTINGFAGDGIYINGYVSSNFSGNTSNSTIQNVFIANCLGRGEYSEGGDASVITFMGVQANNNISGGFYDNSDLTNTYISCLAEANGIDFWQANWQIFGGDRGVPSQQYMLAHPDTSWLLARISGVFTGSTEPNWALYSPGDTVVDGQITWKVLAPYITGESFKSRGSGLTRPIYVGSYIEPDQRFADIPFGTWYGDQHNFQIPRGHGTFRALNEFNQGVSFTSDFAGFQAGSLVNDTLSFAFGDAVSQYGVVSQPSTKMIELRETALGLGGPLVMQLPRRDNTNENLGTAGFNPLCIGPSPFLAHYYRDVDAGQQPDSTFGRKGDIAWDRTGPTSSVFAGACPPHGWVCIKSSPDAVWQEFIFDSARSTYAPPGSLIANPFPIGTIGNTFNSNFGIVHTDDAANDQFVGTLPETRTYGVTNVADFATLIDHETLTLNDGVNTPTVFEIDKTGGGVAGGHVQVNVSGLVTATQIRDAIITAVNGVGSSLTLVAEAFSPSIVKYTQPERTGSPISWSNNLASSGMFSERRGLKYHFYCSLGHGIRVIPPNGISIRIGEAILVGDGASYVESNEKGAWLTLESFGTHTTADAQWIATTAIGAWHDSSNNQIPYTGLDIARTDTVNTFSKSQNVERVTLTDASTISVDASLGNVFSVTLGGNRTLANPTNLVDGGVYEFAIKQDTTGNRTLVYGTAFKFPAGNTPTLSTGPRQEDKITAVCRGNVLLCTFAADFEHVASGNSYQDTVMADNPIGYWRLDEASGTTAKDISDLAHNATYNTGWTLAQPGAGSNTGTSVQMATQTWISLTNSDSQDYLFANTQAFSLEGWFKSSSIVTAGVLFDTFGGISGYQGYEIFIGYPDSAKVSFSLANNASISNALTIDGNIGGASVLDGAWHHVVCTYDGSATPGGIKIYLDGSLTAMNTVLNSLSGSIQDLARQHLQFGRRFGDATGFTTGTYLDEIAVYDHVLSSTRVAAHFAAR